MLKAADALDGADYRVRVVSARFVEWAAAADLEARRTRSWPWREVRLDAGSLPRIATGLRLRAARAAARAVGVARLPWALVTRAQSRFVDELARAAREEPADLFYAGTAGGLAPAAMAARAQGVPYALDLEDFHDREHDDTAEGRLSDALHARVVGELYPGAAFATAGSAAIADAYARKYGRRPIAVHNTFPLPDTAASAPHEGPLRLHWFSQTIGPGRGLEQAIAAVGAAGIDAELALRGRISADYRRTLESLVHLQAPRLRLTLLPPIAPDALVASCAAFDVGLALEPARSPNNDLAASNKLFTYLVAGLAVALTDTTGQRPVADELGADAVRVRPGDSAALAAGLRRWHEDRAALARARQASFAAARRRWHWEHDDDRGALLAAVAAALPSR